MDDTQRRRCRPPDAVDGDDADEYFHAWSVARYIQHVAAAGKAAYPLPMYVNASLRDPLSNPRPSSYESGGATDNVLPIWKAAAPAIDVLGPADLVAEIVSNTCHLIHEPRLS